MGASGPYGAVISVPGGGVVFPRLAGYPDPGQPYGTRYPDEAAPPGGVLPEAPYAAALPLAGARGLWSCGGATPAGGRKGSDSRKAVACTG